MPASKNIPTILHSFFILSFIVMSSSLSGQAYPENDFRSPLDIPLNLSGNFGELRTNHFHSGIDIKTNQMEGLNIYAVSEGYVSRIKVSPVGYGYAIYLTHPNGYTTVYGHLKSYSPRISEYVKRQQYAAQSFSVDLILDAAVLPVTKGEIIGLSGNTGGSGGPHLHFEIRETATEKVLNPLLFGFDVRDNIAPSVSAIWFMPLSDSSFINGTKIPVAVETLLKSGVYGLKNVKTPTVSGDVGLAIQTTDVLNGNSNRCGVYRIELFVDSVQVFGQTLQKLDFGVGRAMNAHTYYEMFKKNRSSIHRSYRLPNNTLDIYDNLVNDGVLSFNDGELHKIEYRVYDVKGNKSVVKFNIQSAPPSAVSKKTPAANVTHFDFDRENFLDLGEVKIRVPEYSLYEDIDFKMEKKTPMSGGVSPTYVLASPYIPLHNPIDISIQASGVKPKYQDKAIIVRWDADKDRIIPEGGKFEDGFIKTTSQYFGHFGIMIDSVAPYIASRDFAANMKGRSSFSFTVRDALSDVDQIIPEIDDNWALMEYEPKSDRLTYYFDPAYITHGKHTFSLRIIDERGNEKKYEGAFEW